MQEIKRNKVWQAKYCPGNSETDGVIKDISKETGLSELCSRLIFNRGFKTADLYCSSKGWIQVGNSYFEWHTMVCTWNLICKQL